MAVDGQWPHRRAPSRNPEAPGMNRRHFALIALAAPAAMAAVTPAAAEDPPTTWDGLVRVPSKKIKLVYLAPGADFRAYSKVMLDPTEVAFRKDWRRNYNEQQEDLEQQVSASYVQDAVKNGVKASDKIFEKAFTDGGYPVVTAAGPDVLRVRTALLNISVTAPDTQSAEMTTSGAGSAGQATFVVEARDSKTNALLGRAVDAQIAGDTGFMTIRTRVSNLADFQELVKHWASASVKGLDELKTLSPVNPSSIKK
jgi:hypothetical protein